jgi:arginase family enzyme
MHGCARPGLRAGYRNTGNRRTSNLAGAGDHAPASGLQFVGMDLVEVCPAYDVAEIAALAGATIAWEYLCLLGIAGSC